MREVEEGGLKLTQVGEAADEARVGKQRDRDKLQAAQFEADIREVMSYAAGRRLVARILKECGVGGIAFRDTDRTTAFALGCQNTGHWLVAHIRQYCLDSMRLMEDEDRHGSSN